jgi:hypothetical protein
MGRSCSDLIFLARKFCAGRRGGRKIILDIAAVRAIDFTCAMKNNPVGALLVAGLLLCSLLSIGLVIYYLTTVLALERLRVQSVQMNNTMTFLQDMANTALNYSRTNAAIDPILQQYSLKPRPAAPAAPAALPGPVRTNR